MYCMNCGTKSMDRDKFCGKCGTKLNNIVNTQTRNTNKKKGEKKFIILSICLIGAFWLSIVGFIASMYFLLFLVNNDTGNSDFITLMGINVPSIAKVVDTKTICLLNTNYDNKDYSVEIDYCDDSLSKREFDKYLSYLINEENFEEIDSNYYRTVLKHYGENKYVEITIDIDEDIIYYDYYYDYLSDDSTQIDETM